MKAQIMSSIVASYKQIILLANCWSHLLYTVSIRLHVGIFARSSIIISYEQHTNMKIKTHGIYIYSSGRMLNDSE